ncbi:MAG: hydrogenase nickel incorporation protein HypB [Clostridia bacterium]|nr:hydrogenase nickel incorporation protein HypB [Clostridia bacterium]
MQYQVDTPILNHNQLQAQQNKDLLKQKKVFMINIMSAPGAGKTTLLEKSIDLLKNNLKLAVIEGDLATALDAERIAKKGVPVIQINTNGGCHLDARMIGEKLELFDLDDLDLVIVENVGNLVCPAEFDLGEDLRIVVLSTAEGNDKVTKYPVIFRQSHVLLVNKIDLIPFTDFTLERLYQDSQLVNKDLLVMEASARTGQGIKEWCEWLEKASRSKE